MSGIPLLLVVGALVVYALFLLIGTLTSMDAEADESDESGRGGLASAILAAGILWLLERYGR